METDLNYFLSNNDTVRTIVFNFTSPNETYQGFIDIPVSGIAVTGMDIVITFMVIQTIVLIMVLWYQMRLNRKHGGGWL